MTKYVIHSKKHNDYVAAVKEKEPLQFEACFCKTKRGAIKFKTKQSADKAIVLIHAICDDDEFEVVEVTSK